MKASGSLKLDHLVIVVADLDKAISNFTELGFVVERGGTNGPTHNALIFFKNRVYIELISARSRNYRATLRTLYVLRLLHLLAFIRPLLRWRFAFWLAGDFGLRDWCIKSEDIDGFCSLPERKQLNLSRKQAFSRTRPDGEVLNWFLAGPMDRNLPFIIQDISDPSLRSPLKKSCEHPNKVEYVSAIVLNRKVVSKKGPQFLAYLGLAELVDGPVAMGEVEVRISDDKSSPMIALELSADGSVGGELPKALTSGAAIKII